MPACTMADKAGSNIKIAILSGKGGTGKTLIAVNLAAVADCSQYIDCDVEEPNGRLFLQPSNIIIEQVAVKIPVVDHTLCNGCRKCVDFCAFNALAYGGGKLVVFEDTCHSCGGCTLLCPQNALSEKDKIIGYIEKGQSHNIDVSTGILNIGEASGIPIIGQLLKDMTKKPIFIDCPPGSACLVMESIKDADYCVLVAEPSLFGAHNLNMVYELVNLFGKPFGVILNKCTEGRNPSEEFCIDKGTKILGRIPFDKELGLLNSNAEIVAKKSKKYTDIFTQLLYNIYKEYKEASYQATTYS